MTAKTFTTAFGRLVDNVELNPDGSYTASVMASPNDMYEAAKEMKRRCDQYLKGDRTLRYLMITRRGNCQYFVFTVDSVVKYGWGAGKATDTLNGPMKPDTWIADKPEYINRTPLSIIKESLADHFEPDEVDALKELGQEYLIDAVEAGFEGRYEYDENGYLGAGFYSEQPIDLGGYDLGEMIAMLDAAGRSNHGIQFASIGFTPGMAKAMAERHTSGDAELDRLITRLGAKEGLDGNVESKLRYRAQARALGDYIIAVIEG